MQEQERILSQMFEGDFNNIPSAREPCMSVSHASFGLETPRP
jgi:hypothetical protein